MTKQRENSIEETGFKLFLPSTVLSVDISASERKLWLYIYIYNSICKVRVFDP